MTTGTFVITGGWKTTLAALTVIPLAVVVLCLVIGRIPKVMAWLKRHDERRILAGKVPPSVLPRFIGQEMCPIPLDEEAEFAEMAREFDHGWIREALKGALKGREQ